MCVCPNTCLCTYFWDWNIHRTGGLSPIGYRKRTLYLNSPWSPLNFLPVYMHTISLCLKNTLHLLLQNPKGQGHWRPWPSWPLWNLRPAGGRLGVVGRGKVVFAHVYLSPIPPAPPQAFHRYNRRQNTTQRVHVCALRSYQWVTINIPTRRSPPNYVNKLICLLRRAP